VTLAAIIALLKWTLPLVKAGVAAVTKSDLPQEIIDALQGAANAIEKVASIDLPTRAQVLALDIDPAAWGPDPRTPAPNPGPTATGPAPRTK
jgi:hypothetical protein